MSTEKKTRKEVEMDITQDAGMNSRLIVGLLLDIRDLLQPEITGITITPYSKQSEDKLVKHCPYYNDDCLKCNPRGERDEDCACKGEFKGRNGFGHSKYRCGFGYPQEYCLPWVRNKPREEKCRHQIDACGGNTDHCKKCGKWVGNPQEEKECTCNCHHGDGCPSCHARHNKSLVVNKVTCLNCGQSGDGKWGELHDDSKCKASGDTGN